MNTFPCSYAAIDIETTGLSPRSGGRVIEIAAVLVENGVASGEFNSLVNIDESIPQEVIRIHGITNSMLVDQPKAIDVMPRFLDFVEGRVLIAHNSKFDIGFIKYELAKINMAIANKHLCTLKMSRKLFLRLPNHRLATVARHLLRKLPKDVRLHRALDDARLTAKIFVEMEGKRDFSLYKEQFLE